MEMSKTYRFDKNNRNLSEMKKEQMKKSMKKHSKERKNNRIEKRNYKEDEE